MDFNDMKKIENDNVTLSDKIKEEELKLPNLNSKELELPRKISGTLDLSKLDLNALKQLVELLRNSKLNSKLFEAAKLPEKISVDLDLSKLDPSVLAQLKLIEPKKDEIPFPSFLEHPEYYKTGSFSDVEHSDSFEQIKVPKIEKFPSPEFKLDREFQLDSELVEKIEQLNAEREMKVNPINLDSKVASQLELPKLQTTDDFGLTPEKIEIMRKLDFSGPDLRLEELEENGPVRINTNRAVDLYTYNELKDEKGKLGAFHTAMQDDENPYSEEKGRSR